VAAASATSATGVAARRVRLHRAQESADGEGGYPGALTALVTYSLPSPSTLRIEYTALTDAPTVCNLTNHAYYNLKDGGASKALEHRSNLTIPGPSLPCPPHHPWSPIILWQACVR
jgi:galactose mutarotase-like enzyme